METQISYKAPNSTKASIKLLLTEEFVLLSEEIADAMIELEVKTKKISDKKNIQLVMELNDALSEKLDTIFYNSICRIRKEI